MSHATPLHDRGSLADSMQMWPRCSLPGNGQEEVYRQVHARALEPVKWTLERALDGAVRASLGRARSQRAIVPRCPEETRRGDEARERWTPDGRMADLPVPKRRRGNRHLAWQTITRYAHCWGPLEDQPLRHYCWGHSRRDVQAGMHLSLGEVFSRAACQRLVLGLEERAPACKTARLAAPPPIVLVDALWRKLAVPSGALQEDAMGRQRPVKCNQPRVLLPALGIWPAGHGEMLA